MRTLFKTIMLFGSLLALTACGGGGSGGGDTAIGSENNELVWDTGSWNTSNWK